jgi:WD40 repeat protein
VVLSPDGKIVLCLDKTGKLESWDLSTRKVAEVGYDFAKARCLAIGPDGKLLAEGEMDGTVRLLKLRTKDPVRSWKAHDHAVTHVHFSKERKWLVTSDGTSLKLWDTSTGKEIRTLAKTGAGICAVAISKDGKTALTGTQAYGTVPGDEEANVSLWDLSTGKRLSRFRGHTFSVASVGFSPEGRYILSGSLDGTIRVWDTKNGGVALTITPENKEKGYPRGIEAAAFSSTGRYILAGVGGEPLAVWEKATGKPVMRFEGNHHSLRGLILTPDGRKVLAWNNRILALWNMETGALVWRLRGS